MRGQSHETRTSQIAEQHRNASRLPRAAARLATRLWRTFQWLQGALSSGRRLVHSKGGGLFAEA